MEGTRGVTVGEFKHFYEGGIYAAYRDIPPELLQLIDPESPVVASRKDYAGMLYRGREWVIEPLRLLQPRSYHAIVELAGPLLIGIKRAESYFPNVPPGAFIGLVIECGGRLVEVFPTFPGNTFEDGIYISDRMLSIPTALAMSWLWRTQGWRIKSEPYGSPLVNRGLIAHPATNWPGTEKYLDSLGRGKRKWFLPYIVELFPDCLEATDDDVNLYNFRCFLDTRPGTVDGPLGDQLFVVSTRRDQVVYHIHHGDVQNIRVLHDPVDAIDRYSAHTLRNLPGEFDFSPWSEPYKP
jgi:hypothetical protein